MDKLFIVNKLPLEIYRVEADSSLSREVTSRPPQCLVDRVNRCIHKNLKKR